MNLSLSQSAIRVGTAGWTLPTPLAGCFSGGGTHLERYGRVFNATEINSSFYRTHLRSTYARWAAGVPEDFRFSVKMPQTITHEHRLREATVALDAFLGQIAALGTRLGCVLVQLPPSLEFEFDVAHSFLVALRERYDGAVAVEPRHATWFAPASTCLLRGHRCTRVAADPARVPAAARVGAWKEVEYRRLHGSPRIYASSYDEVYLRRLATKLVRAQKAGKMPWCIFDNTMFGSAAANGLTLQACVRAAQSNPAASAAGVAESSTK